jgi:glycosyltransferase involved in cell wall biosynthesis
MKILLVNMSVDSVLGGGTVERTCQLAKELRKLPDTEAKILSTTVGLDQKTITEHEQDVLLPCFSDRWYIPAPYFFKVYQSIKWADVIVLSSHWTLINAMVYFVNKFVRRPYLFCPAGALHIFGRSGLVKRLYNAVVGNSIVKNASRLIAIPRDEGDYFHELGVERERISVIPNGISPSDFIYSDTRSFREKYNLGASPILLFMGRLNEIKGPDILLDAFAGFAKEHPSWHLVYAGPDGGLKASLSENVREHGLERRVHLIGFVSGKEKSEAYHAADLLVVPSRLEAMSIVALEASICGSPVLMTDQCGFSELVEAGGGIEVPVSAVDLKDALNLLMLNRGHLRSMGQKAKQFIRSHYTWEIAAKSHRKLCEEVCSEE